MANAQQNKEATESILSRYLLDEFIDWINKNMEPSDIFDEPKLSQWAEDNGYRTDDEYHALENEVDRLIDICRAEGIRWL